jgi:hypothetical protein
MCCTTARQRQHDRPGDTTRSLLGSHSATLATEADESNANIPFASALPLGRAALLTYAKARVVSNPGFLYSALLPIAD